MSTLSGSFRSLWPHFTQRQPYENSLQAWLNEWRQRAKRSSGETRWGHLFKTRIMGKKGNTEGFFLVHTFVVCERPKSVCICLCVQKRKVSESSAVNWMLLIKLIDISGPPRTSKVSPGWSHFSFNPSLRLHFLRKAIWLWFAIFGTQKHGCFGPSSYICTRLLSLLLDCSSKMSL